MRTARIVSIIVYTVCLANVGLTLEKSEVIQPAIETSAVDDNTKMPDYDSFKRFGEEPTKLGSKPARWVDWKQLMKRGLGSNRAFADKEQGEFGSKDKINEFQRHSWTYPNFADHDFKKRHFFGNGNHEDFQAQQWKFAKFDDNDFKRDSSQTKETSMIFEAMQLKFTKYDDTILRHQPS